jgi:hypothetical protein
MNIGTATGPLFDPNVSSLIHTSPISVSLSPEINSFLSYSFRDTPGIAYGLSIQYSSEFIDMVDQINAEKVQAAFTR